MLEEVLLERHGFLHHLMMDAGSVEQMQSVIMPNGNTDMLRIKTSDRCDNGDDIPIVDGIAQQLRIGELFLWNITVLSSVYCLFLFTDSWYITRIYLEHPIEIRMLGHVVNLNGLYGREGRVRRLYLLAESHGCIILDP